MLLHCSLYILGFVHSEFLGAHMVIFKLMYARTCIHSFCMFVIFMGGVMKKIIHCVRVGGGGLENMTQ